MELLLLALLGVILLVVDRVGAHAEWVQITGIVLLVLAGVLFLATLI